MNPIPKSLLDLISEFSKLPGIGKKTAERLSLHVLKTNKDYIETFMKALDKVKNDIETCNICFAYKDGKCSICYDTNRDHRIICVLKDAVDVFLIEKSGYKGLYHILDGLISPLDGVKAEHLNIDQLLIRINDVDEIVLGVEPSTEGDVTNLYLLELLHKYDIKVTRLARGMPIGSSLEFIDEVTLKHSVDDRIEIK